VTDHDFISQLIAVIGISAIFGIVFPRLGFFLLVLLLIVFGRGFF
jgi:hypothetical protein